MGRLLLTDSLLDRLKNHCNKNFHNVAIFLFPRTWTTCPQVLLQSHAGRCSMRHLCQLPHPFRSRSLFVQSLMNCPNCGFPVDGRNLPRTCPKCDEDLIRAKARRPLQVDLAHSGETVETALRKLEAAVSECLWHGHASLKVIHGYGSTGGASRIRPHILHALQKHAERHGGRVAPDGQNPGAHVLWLR